MPLFFYGGCYSLSAGMITLEYKTRAVPCFLVVYGNVGYGIQEPYHFVIHNDFHSIAFDHAVAVVQQLIQSQPQAGSSSTISGKH